jgi:hypothetical protein
MIVKRLQVELSLHELVMNGHHSVEAGAHADHRQEMGKMNVGLSRDRGLPIAIALARGSRYAGARDDLASRSACELM